MIDYKHISVIYKNNKRIFETLHAFILFMLLCSIPFHIFADTGEAISLKAQLSTEPDSKRKVDLLLQFSEEIQFSDPGQALVVADEAMQLSDSLNYSIGQLGSYLRLSSLNWGTSDFSAAMDYANQALVMANKLHMREEKAKALRAIGVIFTSLGEHQKSAEYFFESLRIFEQLSDSDGMAKAYNSIGNAYSAQDDVEKATEYYGKSLEIARRRNNPVGISGALNNIAMTYVNTGNYDETKLMLLEAVRINREIGMKYWEAINYLNLGDICLKQEIYDSAYYYLGESEEILKNLNNIPILALTYLSMSSYFIAQEDWHQASDYAMKTLHNGKEHGLPELVQDASQALSEIYLFTGDTIQAFHYLKQFHNIKDSLGAQNNITRIAQLELLHNFDKQNQERKYQNQKQRFIYSLIILIIIFLALAGIFVLVARHRISIKNEALLRQKLSNELEMNQKELMLSVMSLMKKNEILTNITSKLKLEQKKAEQEETKLVIRKIVRELKKTGEAEVWQELETRFKQVHSDFYQNLLEQHPDLTPNELKLCAFMRLNLSTKDVSELTGQRTASIEMARSRLRKKLGISHSQTSLVGYLSHF